MSGYRPCGAALGCGRVCRSFLADERSARLALWDPGPRHGGLLLSAVLSVRCARPLLRIVAPGLSDRCQGHPQTRLRRARRSLCSLAPAGWGAPPALTRDGRAPFGMRKDESPRTERPRMNQVSFTCRLTKDPEVR